MFGQAHAGNLNDLLPITRFEICREIFIFSGYEQTDPMGLSLDDTPERLCHEEPECGVCANGHLFFDADV